VPAGWFKVKGKGLTGSGGVGETVRAMAEILDSDAAECKSHRQYFYVRSW